MQGYARFKGTGSCKDIMNCQVWPQVIVVYVATQRPQCIPFSNALNMHECTVHTDTQKINISKMKQMSNFTFFIDSKNLNLPKIAPKRRKMGCLIQRTQGRNHMRMIPSFGLISVMGYSSVMVPQLT